MFPSEPEAVIYGSPEHGENQQSRDFKCVPPGVDTDWKAKSVISRSLSDSDHRLITVSRLERYAEVDDTGNMFCERDRNQIDRAASRAAEFHQLYAHHLVAHFRADEIENE